MDENKWHMDEITWTFEEHKKAIEETYQRGYFDGVHSKGGIYKEKQEPTTKNYLSEEDILELKHRYGDEVEFIVRDMISGEGKRWE